MKIVKKVSFSLIEVSIALFLAAVMIGLLFSTFTYSTKVKNQIEHTTTTVLKRKYIQEKLTQMLSNACSDFTCKENRLTFAVDQGPDIDPNFSGQVKVSLYLNHGQLHITEQSLQDEDLTRSEVLLENITALEWTFLPQPEANDFGKNLSQSSWTDQTPPLAIRLTLTMNDNTSIPFAFFTNSPVFEMPK